MTIQGNPLYENRPVIVVHLITTWGEKTRAACADYSYVAPSSHSFPNVPRVLCTACRLVTL
jgi:hypothetical protein